MPGLLAAWDQGVGAWPGIEPTRRAPSSAKAQLVWRTPGARRRCRWAMVAPHRRCGGHRRELPRCRWAVVALHPLCGAAPVMWRCTRTERV